MKRLFVRDRIKEFRRVPAADLRPSPSNFRRHPEQQRRAMRALLNEIGYAGAALARELPGGKLELIDGHMRAEESTGDVPTLILDVSEAEAKTLMAFYDPIGDMATTDDGALRDLLAEVTVASDDLLDSIAERSAADPVGRVRQTIDDFDISPPPRRVWILVAAGEDQAALIEELSAREMGSRRRRANRGKRCPSKRITARRT